MRRAATLFTATAALAPSAASAQANTIVQLREQISRCLHGEMLAHPEIREPQAGITVTIRLALKRNGELLGEPVFTFRGQRDQPRRVDYQRALAFAVSRCTPTRVTDALGGAIAGRPIIFTFTETRGQRSA